MLFFETGQSGLLYTYDDGNFQTLLYGVAPNTLLNLPSTYTHFGVVREGSMEVNYLNRHRELEAEDFFSVSGAATISAKGTGIVLSARAYAGLNVFGGPIERTGRLRYIDGCTDTLLIPPVRRGDPCLNLLHFPPAIVQTPHTHPSVRAGIVLRGQGVCVRSKDDQIPLRAGTIFLIPTNGTHSFNTTESSMDVVAFHPDSDFGPTDHDHPMVNRTIVDGIPANRIDKIRTKD